MYINVLYHLQIKLIEIEINLKLNVITCCLINFDGQHNQPYLY